MPQTPPPLYRRLLIAFIVSIAVAASCWLLLPQIGVSIPWWVPVTAFCVILASALLALRLSERPDDPDGPIPFRPLEDEGEGVSAADRERFG